MTRRKCAPSSPKAGTQNLADKSHRDYGFPLSRE
jgi:hypothetical protein